jgi:hypothetical protein
MHPPFGGKEGKEAQTRFAYKTGATQLLFLQHVIDSLKSGGRCGIVLDGGVLFRTTETAFVQTKRKLRDECDLRCIVSLPGGVFTAAGAGVKTNLLFFTKGGPTERTWYYDLSGSKTTTLVASVTRAAYLPQTSSPKSERLYSGRSSSTDLDLTFFIDFPFSFSGVSPYGCRPRPFRWPGPDPRAPLPAGSISTNPIILPTGRQRDEPISRGGGV